MSDFASLDELRAAHPEVQLDVGEDEHGITLSLVRVTENRGQGLGSAAVRDLIAYADARGLPVALTPDPLGRGGLSKIALEAWYRSLGFVPNRGRNKDFNFRESMIRPARAIELEQASQPTLAPLDGAEPGVQAPTPQIDRLSH